MGYIVKIAMIATNVVFREIITFFDYCLGKLSLFEGQRVNEDLTKSTGSRFLRLGL